MVTVAPDPHGQSALMLCEGLLLLLLEKGVLDHAAIMGLLRTVIDVKEEIPDGMEEPVVRRASLALLEQIEKSLSVAQTGDR